MSKKDILLTSEGFLELEEELNNLKNVRRPRVIEAIKDARAQGDLSENADYDAARDEQARIEGRIVEIETILKNCVIIKGEADADAVEVGKTVEIEFVGMNLVKKYTIVGTIEANPFENKISDASPIGAELTKTITVDGKQVPKYRKGDVATYTTEQGKQLTIKILNVSLSE